MCEQEVEKQERERKKQKAYLDGVARAEAAFFLSLFFVSLSISLSFSVPRALLL